jgi:hypothetical protein
MSHISRDEWLKALGESYDPPDPDAVTSAEFGKMIGRGIIAARNRLNRLVEDGKAQRTTKLIRRADGVTQTVQAYRLVTGKR